MKAIRVHEMGDPDVMKLEEVASLKPEAGQVLVQVMAAGVNPVDTYIRAGMYGAVELPYTPGMDAAGIVEAVGEGVSGFSEGDRVYVAGSTTGTYAEQCLCSPAQVHPLPQKVSFLQGAGVYVPYATAYRALFNRARAKGGQKLLVHGASGAVGVAAIQIARAAGLKIYGTAGTEKGRQLVEAQGAIRAYDHTQPDYLEKAIEDTGGTGFDIILEMLANVNLNSDLAALAMNGAVVVIGSRGTLEFDPRGIMRKDATVKGMVLMNTAPDELASIHASLVAGLEAGIYAPVIGCEMPLGDAPKAHVKVMQPGAYGKIVLTTQ